MERIGPIMSNCDLPPLGAVAGVEELEDVLDLVASWRGQGQPPVGFRQAELRLSYVRQEAARLLREAAPEDHLRRARLRVAHRLAETWLAEIGGGR